MKTEDAFLALITKGKISEKPKTISAWKTRVKQNKISIKTMENVLLKHGAFKEPEHWVLPFLFMLISLTGFSQHVPASVEDTIMARAVNGKTGVDTIVSENYRYIVDVKTLNADSTNFMYTLVDKKKLYVDYWKAGSVAVFLETMGEFVTVPHLLAEDKVLHYAAGQVIGGGSTVFYYHLTKRKWLSAGLGAGTGIAVGGLKELTDPWHGGTKSFADFKVTGIGSVVGALKIRIFLKGNKKKKILS